MNAIIYEYEDVLLGKKTSFSNVFFINTQRENQKNVLLVFKHAFEVYLKWTPYEIYELISWDILKRMKLDTLVKFINFPPELDATQDLQYIATLLYPSIIQYNFKKMCLISYKKVLANHNSKLPKGFLSENVGLLRGHICLQYILSEKLNFENIEDLYAHFASAAGMKTLKKYRLSGMCTDFYETPLEFVHNALPEYQQNSFLYNYYRFRNSFFNYQRNYQ